MLHHTKNKQFSQLKSNTAEQDITLIRCSLRQIDYSKFGYEVH